MDRFSFNELIPLHEDVMGQGVLDMVRAYHKDLSPMLARASRAGRATMGLQLPVVVPQVGGGPWCLG
jgi:hypothetical protein